jgi:hypothetical protein
MAIEKSLDRKLAAIHADPHGCKEFILADAKDADMAFGLGAPGQSPEAHSGELRFKTLEEYREQIRANARQGMVDIMLMSSSTNYQLTLLERLFENSHVTPAIRANDTTDVHLARGSHYAEHPALPFRSASLDHAMCGHLDCTPQERHLGANLGLYSVTFNNDIQFDIPTLERFHQFREEAERKGFRYFLEIFDPNITSAIAPELLGSYINDMIARMLAGVAGAGRPTFLKMVYHGPKAMEDLVRYDPHLVVGILGGGSGTTLDAFHLLAEAQKYGAKVALYGRKINSAENQLAFIHFLRLIVDGVIEPVDAVKAYHAVLQKLGVRPHRPLEEDLKLQANSMSYGGTATSVVVSKPAAASSNGKPADCKCHEHVVAPVAVAKTDDHDCACHAAEPVTKAAEPVKPSRPRVTISSPAERASGFPTLGNGLPDFTKMDVAQRLAYHRARLGLGD